MRSARRLLRRQGRVGEGKEQRQRHRDQHAQRGARRVFRKMHRVERWRAALQIDQRLKQIAAGLAEKNQEADDQQDREHVPTAEQTRPAADRYRDKHSHASSPAVIELSWEAWRQWQPQTLRSHIIAAGPFKPFCRPYRAKSLLAANLSDHDTAATRRDDAAMSWPPKWNAPNRPHRAPSRHRSTQSIQQRLPLSPPRSALSSVARQNRRPPERAWGRWMRNPVRVAEPATSSRRFVMKQAQHRPSRCPEITALWRHGFRSETQTI